MSAPSGAQKARIDNPFCPSVSAMCKELVNIFIVLWGLWVASHAIAFVEETFVAWDLSRPVREAGGLLGFAVGVPLWAAVMSLLMIM